MIMEYLMKHILDNDYYLNAIEMKYQFKSKICFLIFLSITFFSCSKKAEKIPDDVLSQKKMIEVLADIQVAEAGIQLRNSTPSDSVSSLAISEYKYVFEKHHISDSIFKKSFLYYTSHPDLMSDMYKEVITTLSKRQAEINKSK